MARNNLTQDAKPLTEREVLKWEIAAELGLDQKIIDNGWRSLSAAESGRIGGILARRTKRA